MKRTLGMSMAILFGCWFVGCVLKAEAAEFKAIDATAQVQPASEGCDDSGAYWSLFAAAAAAQ